VSAQDDEAVAQRAGGERSSASAPAPRPRPQRRYRRLTLRLDVSYLAEESGAVASAVATTLGAGGLFIPTEHPLHPGEAVRVRFRLPWGGPAFELAARVVWANHASTPGVPPSGRGMGIAFRDPAAQRRLAAALSDAAERSEIANGPGEARDRDGGDRPT